MKIHRLFIAITFALSPAILDAQEVTIGNDDDKPIEERIIYNREQSMHATLNSRGLGAGFEFGNIRDIHTTTFWDFSIDYLRAQKQIKLWSGTGLSTTSFVYGKLNEAVLLKGGYKVEKRIFGKPSWNNGVELRWLYGAGATLAVLKPYYYTVIVIVPTSTGEYTQEIDYQTFDNESQWAGILGRAPFKYGLDEIALRPGLYAKGGMSFEIGRSQTKVQAIEFGAEVDGYPIGLNLMDENPSEHFIFTLYLSYRWGSRYNKY